MNKVNKCIEPGQWVALTMKANSAPLRCYVGEVQAVDEHGVRVTLIDWIIGAACGYDFFAPWDRIASALVATKAHDLEGFGGAASQWQTRCGDMQKQPAVFAKTSERPVHRLAEATAWLANHLKEGRKRAKDVRFAAEAEQRFPTRTLYCAKDALGIEESFVSGQKWWELPAKDSVVEIEFS